MVSFSPRPIWTIESFNDSHRSRGFPEHSRSSLAQSAQPLSKTTNRILHRSCRLALREAFPVERLASRIDALQLGSGRLGPKSKKSVLRIIGTRPKI